MSGYPSKPLAPSVPLESKMALSYKEVQALGLCSERKLRQLVSVGKVKRSVLRSGRSIRFLREELIEELRAG